MFHGLGINPFALTKSRRPLRLCTDRSKKIIYKPGGVRSVRGTVLERPEPPSAPERKPERLPDVTDDVPSVDPRSAILFDQDAAVPRSEQLEWQVLLCTWRSCITMKRFTPSNFDAPLV
jgi:hypothetical protein